MGKLHLIDLAFIRWASTLMVFTVNFFSKSNLIKYRRNTITVGMEHLHKNESIYNAFKEAISNNDMLSMLNLDDTALENLHRYLTAYTFHAYSGFRWDAANYKSNIAFRQLIQTTGSADGSRSDVAGGTTKAKKPKEKNIYIHHANL